MPYSRTAWEKITVTITMGFLTSKQSVIKNRVQIPLNRPLFRRGRRCGKFTLRFSLWIFCVWNDSNASNFIKKCFKCVENQIREGFCATFGKWNVSFANLIYFELNYWAFFVRSLHCWLILILKFSYELNSF